MTATDARFRDSLVATYQQLKQEGLIYGSAGNISIRQDNHVWITPSGIAPEDLTVDHICVMNIDGTHHSVPEGVAPSSEVPMHLEIYRQTSAVSVVHGHSTYAVTAGLVADEIPAIHYVMRRLGGAVQVVPYELFGSADLATEVAAALQDRSAALMRNHGAVTYGSSLADALESYRTIEWICEVYLGALAVGKPAELQDDQLMSVARAAKTKGYRL